MGIFATAIGKPHPDISIDIDGQKIPAYQPDTAANLKSKAKILETILGNNPPPFKIGGSTKEITITTVVTKQLLGKDITLTKDQVSLPMSNFQSLIETLPLNAQIKETWQAWQMSKNTRMLLQI